MGRPIKQGLEYFSLDVRMFSDIKIRKLIKYHKAQAVSVYMTLLCRIYEKGYFIEYDNDLPFIISEDCGLEEDTIVDIINYCMKVGLFDEGMFKQHKVLTSHGIQDRYVQACAKTKRKLSSGLPYLLVDVSQEDVSYVKKGISSEENQVSSEEKVINSEENQVNSEKSTQSKEKKRKEKHSSSADIRAREGETAVAVVDDESQVFSSVDEEIVQLRASPIWKEQVLMRFKFLQCNEQTLFEYLDRWGAEVKISGKQHFNLGDAKHHFCNWMIIQEGKLSKTGGNNGTSNNNGYRTSEDILTGAVGIINELRAEGAQPKRKLPVV